MCDSIIPRLGGGTLDTVREHRSCSRILPKGLRVRLRGFRKSIVRNLLLYPLPAKEQESYKYIIRYRLVIGESMEVALSLRSSIL